MLRYAVLTTGFLLNSIAFSAPNNRFEYKPLVKVNSQTLLVRDFETPEEVSSPLILEQGINRLLFLQEAKRLKLDKEAEVKDAFFKVLLKRYKQELVKNIPFPTAETLYQTAPLLRVRLLSVSEKRAPKVLEKIKRALVAGTPFKTLCVDFSEDPSSPFGGDIDFRGKHNFPLPLFDTLVSLKENEVSLPINYMGAIHFIQWFEKKPFSTAPATYLQFLKADWQTVEENKRLLHSLAELRNNAEIELLLNSPSQVP